MAWSVGGVMIEEDWTAEGRYQSLHIEQPEKPEEARVWFPAQVT